MSNWRENVRVNTIEMVKRGITELEKGNHATLSPISNRLSAADLLFDDDELTLITFTITPLFRFIQTEIDEHPQGEEFAKEIAETMTKIIDNYEKRDNAELFKGLLNFAGLCRTRRKQTEFISRKKK